MVFKKIIFQNRYVALETPPFMANAILNFHFDFLTTSLTHKCEFPEELSLAEEQLEQPLSTILKSRLLRLDLSDESELTVLCLLEQREGGGFSKMNFGKPNIFGVPHTY